MAEVEISDATVFAAFAPAGIEFLAVSIVSDTVFVAAFKMPETPLFFVEVEGSDVAVFFAPSDAPRRFPNSCLECNRAVGSGIDTSLCYRKKCNALVSRC